MISFNLVVFHAYAQKEAKEKATALVLIDAVGTQSLTIDLRPSTALVLIDVVGTQSLYPQPSIAAPPDSFTGYKLPPPSFNIFG
jgi:hypothetical protein